MDEKDYSDLIGELPQFSSDLWWILPILMFAFAGTNYKGDDLMNKIQKDCPIDNMHQELCHFLDTWESIFGDIEKEFVIHFVSSCIDSREKKKMNNT